MNAARIRKIAISYFKAAPPTHDWSHTERVLATSLKIGSKMNADEDVLAAAAVLHDIARPTEKKDHAREGAGMAREILEREGYGEVFIRAVCHCIETHRFRGKRKPETLEAKILYDADKLDAIGAIGVARAYFFAGENGQMLYSRKKHTLKGKIDHGTYSPLNEFHFKLKRIKDRMLTREGKRLAQDRQEFMVRFFKRLGREIAGNE